MPQSAEKVLDHNELFKQPEYQDLMARKKAFEDGASPEKVQQVIQWTKSCRSMGSHEKRSYRLPLLLMMSCRYLSNLCASYPLLVTNFSQI